jgi:hypothetical protein
VRATAPPRSAGDPEFPSHARAATAGSTLTRGSGRVSHTLLSWYCRYTGAAKLTTGMMCTANHNSPLPPYTLAHR